ncbi:hypothetical protein WT15_23835 [Burkholderia stagnalis]|nr:hypothetical protein WT15_23835 [Burkholderia stagnalis]KWO27049.1 hypothetical protein WT96_31230 [Burkholderia stagnalis]KWO45046.1 hypothetical protein WT95_26870 [Burkholderia stagnalis]
MHLGDVRLMLFCCGRYHPRRVGIRQGIAGRLRDSRLRLLARLGRLPVPAVLHVRRATLVARMALVPAERDQGQYDQADTYHSRVDAHAPAFLGMSPRVSGATGV